ncbi:helix-turn-helix transcriptional regulator [Aminobacter anthyllidis]|uniref:Helix-turn-helix transcriptional regulator n=1 Tax=Aminobacter anthyllidis TaxID=1035067 RepID=A0A9X1A9P6_9HYPH|nr:helix-turn-helix domain-containing protein [Aminobacter anthyllidis]MBT1155452.1 helix-turn-helix transcriptional regulator [Aminobacter anthyllidis]
MTQFRSGCPIASALDIIGDKWSLVIIRSMVVGATSYSDLLSTPEKISTNILAERLRRLEDAGLIRQSQPRQGSIRGAYALTTKGAALIPVVQELARWGETQIPDRWTPPERFYAARPSDFAARDSYPAAD